MKCEHYCYWLIGGTIMFISCSVQSYLFFLFVLCCIVLCSVFTVSVSDSQYSVPVFSPVVTSFFFYYNCSSVVRKVFSIWALI